MHGWPPSDKSPQGLSFSAHSGALGRANAAPNHGQIIAPPPPVALPLTLCWCPTMWIYCWFIVGMCLGCAVSASTIAMPCLLLCCFGVVLCLVHQFDAIKTMFYFNLCVLCVHGGFSISTLKWLLMVDLLLLELQSIISYVGHLYLESKLWHATAISSWWVTHH